MRLRDLGGLIVIDFIDMESTKNQREVEITLRDAIKHDRARVQLGKLSRFGLLELSRQRLQPSLGESSHIVCPRCYGVGYIRGTESSALHILRVIQEEALKENTGAVHAQVPVDVATFLLNEKRTELYGLEDRLDVSILLIPNVHLETPSFNVTRVRNDDMDEVGDMPSYRRVEQPEAESVDESEKAKAKVERPEAAVKGVSVQRAPSPVAVKPAGGGLFARIAAWFKGPEEEVAPVKTTKTPQRNERREGNGQSSRNGERRQGNNQRRERGDRQQGENSQNSRGNNRRNNNSDSTRAGAEEATEQRQERRRDREPKENTRTTQPRAPKDKDSSAQSENTRPPRQPKAAPAPAADTGAEATAERGDRRRRRTRRDRRPDEETQTVGLAITAEVTASAEPVAPVETSKPAEKQPRTEPKTETPLVAATEQQEPVRMLIKPVETQAVQSVETTVVETREESIAVEPAVHVAPVNVPVEQPKEEAAVVEAKTETSIAVVEESTQGQSPLVSDNVSPSAPTRAAIEPASPPDLGGLVMVSTVKAETVEQPIVATEEPKGTRRKDVVRIESEQTGSVELMQVETRDDDPA